MPRQSQGMHHGIAGSTGPSTRVVCTILGPRGPSKGAGGGGGGSMTPAVDCCLQQAAPIGPSPLTLVLPSNPPPPQAAVPIWPLTPSCPCSPSPEYPHHPTHPSLSPGGLCQRSPRNLPVSRGWHEAMVGFAIQSWQHPIGCSPPVELLYQAFLRQADLGTSCLHEEPPSRWFGPLLTNEGGGCHFGAA